MNAETKARLIERVKSLEGLTNDERSALLELLRTEKAYGLVWENKPEDVEERLRDELPVLVEDETKRIISDSPDAPNHVLIESDNLEALTTLAYTHAGKIDVIYIDPPYNTGNKDFVYNDAFVDSEDAYRHSKWLSFMSKRLHIAKKLLSDRGVIFISIDDNEQANLKLLCDDVFSERNHVTTFVWQSTAGSNTGTDIVTVTEYIQVYAKNRSVVKFDGQLVSDDNFPYEDEYINERGRYNLDKLDRRRVGGHYSDALNYSITMPDGTNRYPGGSNMKSDEGWNYLWSRTKIQWGLENGFIVFKKSKGKWNVYNKRYSRIDNTGNLIERSVPFRNLITSDKYNTAQGTAEISTIFGIRTFDFPKPSNLIKHLLLTIVRSNNHSTVLDFFAGSGTTLHAVMQLNAEDGGQRQCILVTNNENGICENVTYERNKRVINGYTKPNGDHVEGLHANNLRYYRTAYVGRNRTPQNLRRLVELSTDMLCIKEDLYTECREFAGVKTRKQFFRYYEQDSKRMLIIYREEYVPDLVNLINRLDLPDGERIKVYVFSPSEDPWAGEFDPVEDKITLCALPMAILNAYRRVLPKRREQVIYVDQETSKKPEVPASEPTLFDMNEEGGAQ